MLPYNTSSKAMCIEGGFAVIEHWQNVEIKRDHDSLEFSFCQLHATLLPLRPVGDRPTKGLMASIEKD